MKSFVLLYVLSVLANYVGLTDGYLVGAGPTRRLQSNRGFLRPKSAFKTYSYICFIKDRDNNMFCRKILMSGVDVNVRFAQLLYTDTKYQVLREEMIKINTRNLVYHCRADKSDCDMALAKMRYKASKHFYALSKAVVDYVKNKRQARPTGYVGTATFCQDNICVPDTDPPIVYGGCYTLVSCGGNQTWHLDPVVYKKKKSRFF